MLYGNDMNNQIDKDWVEQYEASVKKENGGSLPKLSDEEWVKRYEESVKEENGGVLPTSSFKPSSKLSTNTVAAPSNNKNFKP